jgi:hypothetical protein
VTTRWTGSRLTTEPSSRAKTSAGGGAEPLTAALDSTTGQVRRQWVGAEFVMAVDSGEQTPVGIIRCSIATGTCEAALPPDRYGRNNVRLLGARS